jgi:hypothetical protein
MHKGFKYLDVTTGQIYISRDVIFDELIFPFASMHPTAGTRYHSDVLLNLPGNDEDTNENCALTMTLVPVLDLAVQVPEASSPVPVSVSASPDVTHAHVVRLPMTLQAPPHPSTWPMVRSSRCNDISSCVARVHMLHV